MDALRNLKVWRRACRLCVDLYKAAATCKDYGFKEQVIRSALSIPSNIAEGYEKDSKKEFIRFLRIAKGSCGELWTQLHIGVEVGFVEKEIGNRFLNEVTELSKMRQGLIKYYQASE
jgi:four helix bundle protein